MLLQTTEHIDDVVIATEEEEEEEWLCTAVFIIALYSQAVTMQRYTKNL
jgi:hypothetical protein